MPRRSILSAAERDSLLSMPFHRDELIRRYTLSESDLSLIRQHRGAANRLGFAVQLCYMRYPGLVLEPDQRPFPPLLDFVAAQVKAQPGQWAEYGERIETRREHRRELEAKLGFRSFAASHYQSSIGALVELAVQTDKGIVLAEAMVEALRRQNVLLPSIRVIERACAEAITRANRRIYAALTEPLSATHRQRLDHLLTRKEDGSISWLAWLRQSPARPNSRSMLEHIERLKAWEAVELPAGLDKRVHQNRLLKIAREGAPMTAADLAKFEPRRRYATLAALVIEGTATVIDEIIGLHDQLIGKAFQTAKNRHAQQFHESGKSINEKVSLYGRVGQALLEAKKTGGDPFAAIEAILPWAAFEASVSEAQNLAQPEDFDFLHHVGESHATLRRYAPALLEALPFRAAPAAQGLLDGIDTLRGMYEDKDRKVPADAPSAFVKKRWQKLVLDGKGFDRRYYELCLLSEIKNALRSGDLWVQGSRQFKDFEEYLVPLPAFTAAKKAGQLTVAVATDCEPYLKQRTALLDQQLDAVSQLAAANGLPDASVSETGLKVAPLEATIPAAALTLIDRASLLLPHVKITELLEEVDRWTGFTRHFTHLKSRDQARDKSLLLSVILADGINIGLTKMAESCPSTTYAKLSWLQAWHVRDETYTAALAELVNTQFRHPFAAHWGRGTASSSDGQRFRVGGRADSTGHINPKYGAEPGRLFYTHVSDQYAPFHTKVINVGVRDSTYVLDGLLYHESDLRIEEHYTDTAGFTDHVFALMHLLGFRFAPRIRDLADTKLYIPKKDARYDALKPMIGAPLNLKQIRTHWDEILRLAASIQQGTVTASLMLRKLGSYPRQNGLALALRELGRMERTLFILDWLQSVELRRRVQAGLNKGEARNALARAVFLHRLGEIRDRSFEQQRYRASGLNLLTAAIVLWNTVYLQRAVDALRQQGAVDESLLPYLSPLGWEHINLTGDYVWRSRSVPPLGRFRPLRIGTLAA
jgi:TnpA family transposase